MRKILFLLLLIVSTNAMGQFHFRLYSGRAQGEIVASRGESFAYNGTTLSQFGQYSYTYQGSAEENCTYSNVARVGLGFKFNKNKLFIEFSPTFDFSSFTYQISSSGTTTYFWDEAHLAPVSQAQISAYGWPQSNEYSLTTEEHDVFAIGLNFNLGFQISDRHSVKLFVCDTRMPLNQFGTDVDWDDSDKQFVSSGDYSYFEIFTNRTLGLSYECIFAKNFYLNIQPSLPIKAFDQKKEEYYLPVKKSPFVNLNIGFQFPNRSEKTQKVKKGKSNSSPTVL